MQLVCYTLYKGGMFVCEHPISKLIFLVKLLKFRRDIITRKQNMIIVADKHQVYELYHKKFCNCWCLILPPHGYNYLVTVNIILIFSRILPRTTNQDSMGLRMVDLGIFKLNSWRRTDIPSISLHRFVLKD